METPLDLQTLPSKVGSWKDSAPSWTPCLCGWRALARRACAT